MNVKVLSTKNEITFRITGAPFLGAIRPVKVTVVSFTETPSAPDRSYVIVSGPVGGGKHLSFKYNRYGHPNGTPIFEAPDWVRELVGDK